MSRAVCASCGLEFALADDADDRLDRFCNGCLADKLTDRYSHRTGAVNCVKRSADE